MIVKNKKEWFTEKIIEYEAQMYRVAYGMLKNNEDAGDAVQETLTTAYNRLDSLKEADKFKPWLMKILSNTSIDMLRRRKDTLSIDEYDVPDDELNSFRDEKIDLWDAVCSLQEEYRAVVLLFYYEGMSISEICRVLDVKQANVKTRLSRSREKLRKLLRYKVE